MNKMTHRLVVITVILLGIVFICSGQRRNDRSPEEIADRQTEKMIKELSLNEKQIEAVTEVNLKFVKEFQKNRQNSKGDREKMRTLIIELNAEKTEELKNILSADQFEKYKALQKERAKEMRNGPNNARSAR